MLQNKVRLLVEIAFVHSIPKCIAFVELKEGESFDEVALRTWCRENLAQFKVPREIRLLDPLPRNPTGKIMRRSLKIA